MDHLRTDFTPDECVRLLWAAVRWERGKREPVRGWVIGRTFRLVLQEYMPGSEESQGTRVGSVIYGRIRPEGEGSAVYVQEFARALDPGLWAVTLPLLVGPFLWWRADAQSKAALLLFYAVGYLLLYMTYRWRQDKYRALTAGLRWFLRKTLNAKEGK